jgi:uncharacterized protein (UPF0333 family)
MSDNGNANNQSGSAKRGFAIIIAFLVIIVILVGVIAFLLGRNTGGSDKESAESSNESSRVVMTEGSRVILDAESAANVMDEMRNEVAEGMFECNMSMTWTFADGSAKSNDAYVANSTNNKYPIYFDVILKDTDEKIYSSPVLPVGSELTNFALDKDLDPGTYKATVMYTLIRDEQSQEEVSSAGFVIKIIVNN